MSQTAKRILLLERNKLHLRRLTRILVCTGAQVVPLESPAGLAAVLDDGVDVLCAGRTDARTVLGVLERHPETQGVLWTEKPEPELLEMAAGRPNLSHILGTPTPHAPPRDWELLLTVRRLLGASRPPLSAYLRWGFIGFQEKVHTPEERDRVVEGISLFCERLNTPSRVRDMLGELAHELLMNAMYDAPVDESGQPLHAHDRKAHISLSEEDAPVIRCASDGRYVLVSVVDRFGRLPREKVFGGMFRGLTSGTMDKSYGGAGLGMLYIYKSTAISVFDVHPGGRTEVLGIYDLDLNQRTFRALPRSVHFFSDQEAQSTS